MKRLTPDRAERLQQATAEATMDFLRRAGSNNPAHILALGLAEATAAMMEHVKAQHRGEILARCTSIMSAVEGRKR